MKKTAKETDQRREGITVLKFIQLLRLFRPKNTKTLARLDKFTDLDIAEIGKLSGINIKGIILDVDNTIAFNRGEILERNAKHVKSLRSKGTKIVLYSNMIKTDRYNVLPKDIEVLTDIAAKPDPRGFKRACSRLGIDRKNIVVVGDNYITDGGAIRLGIPFIKIKPIKRKNEKIIDRVYKIVIDFYDLLSRVHDLGRKKPISLNK